LDAQNEPFVPEVAPSGDRSYCGPALLGVVRVPFVIRTAANRGIRMEDAPKLPARPQLAQGVRTYIEKERERILVSCTSCGKCSEVCPMTQYNPTKGDTTAHDLAGGVLRLLRTGTTDEASIGWIGVCIRSGECVPACPENVNPKLMLRLAKMVATGGLGGEKLIKLKEDREYYARIRAFAQLQLTDQEYKEWME
jgi:ferredoxin